MPEGNARKSCANSKPVADYTLEEMIEEVNRVTREASRLLEPNQLCLNGNYPNFLLASEEKQQLSLQVTLISR